MTVHDLIEILSELDPDATVLVDCAESGVWGIDDVDQIGDDVCLSSDAKR